MSDIYNPHGVQIGDVWKVNDSGNTFMVVAQRLSYAEVVNTRGTRRQILLCNLRESKAKTGYTLVSRLGAAPVDHTGDPT